MQWPPNWGSDRELLRPGRVVSVAHFSRSKSAMTNEVRGADVWRWGSMHGHPYHGAENPGVLSSTECRVTT